MDVDQANVAESSAMDVEEPHPAKNVFDGLLEKARDLETKDPSLAITAYKDIINNKQDLDDPSARGREQAIYALCDFLVTKKDAEGISALNKELRPLFIELPKAKTAKVARALIDYVAKIPGTIATQSSMCQDCIEWCKEGKRTFLRQRVETRLAALLMTTERYHEATILLDRLLSEVKKLDDKLLLVEIHLIACRVNYALQNIPKSSAELTASKTNANAIHCPPLLQADIDLWSGIVCARQKDYRTAFSYFYEAFEAFNAADKEEKARESMKLQMLSKIMMGRPQECHQIVSSKTGLKYTGKEIDAMSAVAKAHKERSLKKFEAVLEQYKAVLGEDGIISFHLTDLNETLLEQNILRILEPFSCVEISHVAELIELPVVRTLSKLSEMILDQKLKGTLDQGHGVLIVFEDEQVRSTYGNALKTIKNTSEVLDTLYLQAKQLA